MKKPLFTGVCTALVTPFLDGKVNYPMVEVLLRRQLDAGVRAVVLAGTTGESATLTEDEKLQLFRRAREFVGQEMLILAGTGSNDTARAVQLSKKAQDAGADGLLVVSPYYNKATAGGLVAHYAAVCQAVEIPVIVYNVPSRTGQDIPVGVCQTLTALPGIAGIKEAATDLGKVTRLLARCGEELTVWCGNDELITPMLSLGAKGVISVMSNVLPEETVLLTEAALAGDFDTAAQLQKELLPLTDALFREVSPIPVKAAMGLLGYDCGDCRLPLTPASRETVERLRRLVGDLL